MSEHLTSPMDEAANKLINAHGKEAEREFFRFVGALGFSQRLTDALSAQNLHALDHIKRYKLFIAAGYQTFDDFLDHDPHSPMKSEAFRRRWNLLQGEGDETFNLLNSLKVPLEARKLLAGEIQVKDNVVTVGGIGTQLDDTERVVELITMLHKKSVEQQRTIERKDKKLAQGEKDFEALKRRAIVANPDATDTGQALLTAAGALQRLRESLAAASPEEKQALREPIFDLLSNSQLDLSSALGVMSAEEVADRERSNENDDIDIDDIVDEGN